MAKVAGPAFSFQARGSLADAVTYRRARGENLARAYASPVDPDTTAQQTQRTKMSAAVTRWHLFDLSANALDRAAWDLASRAFGIMSGSAAFIRRNFIQINSGVAGTNVIYGFAVVSAAHAAVALNVTFPGAGAAQVTYVWGSSEGWQGHIVQQFTVADVLHIVGLNPVISAGGFLYIYFRTNSGSRRSGLYKVKLT